MKSEWGRTEWVKSVVWLGVWAPMLVSFPGLVTFLAAVCVLYWVVVVGVVVSGGVRYGLSRVVRWLVEGRGCWGWRVAAFFGARYLLCNLCLCADPDYELWTLVHAAAAVDALRNCHYGLQTRAFIFLERLRMRKDVTMLILYFLKCVCAEEICRNGGVFMVLKALYPVVLQWRRHNDRTPIQTGILFNFFRRHENYVLRPSTIAQSEDIFRSNDAPLDLACTLCSQPPLTDEEGQQHRFRRLLIAQIRPEKPIKLIKYVLYRLCEMELSAEDVDLVTAAFPELLRKEPSTFKSITWFLGECSPHLLHRKDRLMEALHKSLRYENPDQSRNVMFMEIEPERQSHELAFIWTLHLRRFLADRMSYPKIYVIWIILGTGQRFLGVVTRLRALLLRYAGVLPLLHLAHDWLRRHSDQDIPGFFPEGVAHLHDCIDILRVQIAAETPAPLAVIRKRLGSRRLTFDLD